MTEGQMTGNAFGGFLRHFGLAALAAAGLTILLARVSVPAPNFLIAYGSARAMAVFPIGTTWLWLVQTPKYDAMIRGSWIQICSVIAVAASGLSLIIRV